MMLPSPLDLTLVVRVRAGLAAQAAALWLARIQLERARAALPPEHAAVWRGATARAEARALRELDELTTTALATLALAQRRIEGAVFAVDVHVD
jgi:hypothetical protein